MKEIKLLDIELYYHHYQEDNSYRLFTKDQRECSKNSNFLMSVDNNFSLLEYNSDIVINSYSVDDFQLYLTDLKNDYSSFSNFVEEYSPTHENSMEYDPMDVNYTVKNFMTINLYRYYKGEEGLGEKVLDLNPEFQRNTVWTPRDKSLFIESILMGLPTPSIFLNKLKDETYVVVDGLQRLSTIFSFMENQFALKNLEYMKELEGTYYSEIDEREDNNDKKKKTRKKYLNAANKIRLRDYEIVSHVLDKSVPERVKMDLFSRINKQGVKLNGQELRNAIMTNSTRTMLQNFLGLKNYTAFCKKNVNEKRMQHIELIVRYLSFKTVFDVENGSGLFYLTYDDNANKLMDNFIIELSNNGYESQVEERYMELFDKSVGKVMEIMGEYSFRKINTVEENGEKVIKKSSINTQLYILFLIEIEKYINEDVSKVDVVKNARLFYDYLNKNREFYNACSSATNNIGNIKKSRKYVRNFLAEIFE